MTANPSPKVQTTPAVFELKAAGFTLPIVRLLGLDMDAVAEQMGNRVDQAPEFFRNTPVVIDLSDLPEDAGDVEFPLLVGLLRGYGMIPFGVRGGSKAQHAAAEAMELAILGDAFIRRSKQAPQRNDADDESRPVSREQRPSVERAARSESRFMIVNRPVRSGQRVYAAGGDLTVLAPVSSGAELMADGNIHIYAPMRGRVIAGLKGDVKARIFCQDMRAELVSVAGHYRVSENIPADLKGKQVQVFLDHEVLRIEPL